MVGSALKKFANENGMRVASGVAYGEYRGYTMTMCEGGGWKRVDFSTRFYDVSAQKNLEEKLAEVDLKRTYRVQALDVSNRGLSVVFTDNPGTMKKILAFLDWVLPLLEASGAAKADTCVECGQKLTYDSTWLLVGETAHHMHESCRDKVKRELEADEQIRKEEGEGSHLTGFLGALAGGLIGAVVWAVVLLLGYVASIVGLLIGFLAEKGYNLAKGKQDKGKIAVLVIVIVLSVLIGSFAADGLSLAQMVSSGELDYTYGEIPMLILFLTLNNVEYMSATLSNCGLGLLFAAIGVFGLLRKAKKEVTGVRVVEL